MSKHFVIDEHHNLIEAYSAQEVLSVLEQAIADGSLANVVAGQAIIDKLKCCVTGGTVSVAFVTQAKYNELEASGSLGSGIAYFITDDTTAEDYNKAIKDIQDGIQDGTIIAKQAENARGIIHIKHEHENLTHYVDAVGYGGIGSATSGDCVANVLLGGSKTSDDGKYYVDLDHKKINQLKSGFYYIGGNKWKDLDAVAGSYSSIMAIRGSSSNATALIIPHVSGVMYIVQSNGERRDEFVKVYDQRNTKTTVYADRADRDSDGNAFATTYQKKSDATKIYKHELRLYHAESGIYYLTVFTNSAEPFMLDFDGALSRQEDGDCVLSMEVKKYEVEDNPDVYFAVYRKRISIESRLGLKTVTYSHISYYNTPYTATNFEMLPLDGYEELIYLNGEPTVM